MRYLIALFLILCANIAPAADLPLQKPQGDGANFPMFLPLLGGTEKLQLVQGPALVNIFATWCGPCMEEHPQLMALRRQLNLPIYGIAIHDDPARVITHLGKHGNPYNKIFMDDKGTSLLQLGMDSVPITLFIDARQRVHWLLPEPIMPEMLPALMRQIALEKAGSTPPPNSQNLRPISFVGKPFPVP